MHNTPHTFSMICTYNGIKNKSGHCPLVPLPMGNWEKGGWDETALDGKWTKMEIDTTWSNAVEDKSRWELGWGWKQTGMGADEDRGGCW